MFHYQTEQRKFVKAVMEYMHQFADRDIPGNGGNFHPIQISFPYETPGRTYKGYLIVAPSAAGDGIRLRTGMAKENDDRMVSHYFYKGSKEEILAYLADIDGHINALLESYAQLRESVDRFD